MVTSTSQASTAAQSGHRTLLYGHAVLLRHYHGNMHIGSGGSVIASFQQTLWTVVPICSGAVRVKTLGYVFGGDVLRLFHGHMDECLALPEAGSDNEFRWDEKKQQGETREDEGMGHADLKYGDSVVFIQHAETGLWLSYVTFETKKRGVGRVEEKKAIMLVEGHMDDGFTFSRAQEEESRALDALKTDGRNSNAWARISLSEVIKCLEDLIDYFAQPGDDEEHEEKQNKLRALRNRQDLFQEEGMIALILETIDKFSQYKSRRQFAHYAGEDAAGKWDDISSYLYLLLAAMIRGNRANCAQFAQSYRLDWLVNRLESQQSSKGVLDVLHCVLIDSPEALNMIKEKHIITIISLIDKHGRDPKVLDVLRSLCVGNGVAVRMNQNLICDNLLPGRDLLLQTQLVDHVVSMRPNIYVGLREGSAMYKKWYFEVVVIQHQGATHLPPVLRVGWANTCGFVPYPGGGEHWGSNGAGDDLYSYAFDGHHLWTGGKSRQVRRASLAFQKGDVIGCSLDLTVPQITFSINGVKVCGFFKDFNLDGMFFPVITMSASISCRYVFGGEDGRLKYGPPDEHSPMIESLPPKETLKIEPCFYFGELHKNVISGPTEICDYLPFVPNPVSTSHIQLPTYIENVRDKLAENLHELWSMAKIDQGWTFGETRDHQRKKNPSLTNFERLPMTEKKYVITLAYETLRTLLALGYHITINQQQQQNNRLKMLKLGNNYLQSNGYKPSPLDLSAVTLNEKLEELVELLAENTHNVWARDRIKNGWTYGLFEDPFHKRSPHLVPYNKVDENIKKANRDTSNEAVRTLIAYGYTIEAPTSETGESADSKRIKRQRDTETLTKETADNASRSRTYRAEKTYYEFEVITPGYMRVGWASVSADPSAEIGSSTDSYSFDGYMARKWCHGTHEAFGKQWQQGDTIGCMLDLHDKTISFSLNGELMMDSMGQEIAFRNVTVENSMGFVPAFTFGALQQAKTNFGQDVNTLKFFTSCGLQEGYEPFCVNMVRPLTLWYGKEQPVFQTVEASHPELLISRIQGGSKDRQLAQAVLEKRLNLENVRRREMDVEEEASADGNGQNGHENGISFEHECLPPNHIESRIDETIPEANEEDFSVSTDMVNGGPDLTLRKSTKAGKGQSLDDSSVASHSTGGLKAAASESQLNESSDSFLSPPKDKRTSSKLSLLADKVLDTAKGIADKQTKKSKSSFPTIFRKAKSRDPSPNNTRTRSTEYSSLDRKATSARTGHLDRKKKSPSKMKVPPVRVTGLDGEDSMDMDKDLIPYEFQDAMEQRPAFSQFSEDSDFAQSEAELNELNAIAEQIEEYSYSVRIFPGQDPAQVWVGWVTPNFHFMEKTFEMKKVRHVVLSQLDMDYKLKSSVSRKNCYMVSAGDLQQRYADANQEMSSKRASPGLVIGCFIDTATGTLSFTVNGKEVANKFATTLPLSAAVFRGPKSLVSTCPPRLDVQVLQKSYWSRVPNTCQKASTLKLSGIRGWSMICEQPVSMLAVHIPDEDRCLDVLELIENNHLLDFHAKTLELYQAVCSHGNHRVANALTKHVDERQLMYTIESEFMPGKLRMSFHDLLISMHLDSHTRARMMTQNEYIIPLTSHTQALSLYRKLSPTSETYTIKHQIPSMEDSVSIRPQLAITEKQIEDRIQKNGRDSTAPYFPMDKLKSFVMRSLTKAMEKGAAHIRDPIGGSNANLFVPLMKVCNNLLVMGLLDDDDLHHLLCLLAPNVFDQEHLRNPSGFGLVSMKLDEPVKLEDQLRRYNEIKNADLPSAVTAKKTKEFRCPPREQMRKLLMFRNEEIEDTDDCPCREDIRESLRQFHSSLLDHCKMPEMNAEDEASHEPEAPPAPSLRERLMALVWRAKAQNKVSTEPQEKTPDSMQKLITTTMVRWAEEDFIGMQDLVCEMFSLLHRQYDGVGELMMALEKTYVISVKNREDINHLLKALGIIRSLLMVQAGHDEEELMKNSLKDLMDNRVFFQHPDLMRALCMHETVMQLMVNTLNKAQLQQQASSGAAPMEANTSHSQPTHSSTDALTEQSK
nr:hypothetical protein BaRGS_024268 [Batillaria attramentaria]